MTFDSIRRAFDFSPGERRIFKYIDFYSLRIDEWLKLNTPTEDFIRRYILVGFWLEYRAANHTGGDFSIRHISKEEYVKRDRELHQLLMSSKLLSVDPPKPRTPYQDRYERDKERRDVFFSYFENPINSIQEYLALVGVLPRSQDWGSYLYEFVVHGTII